MKKYGGFIPGIRAGKPTAEYLDYVLTRITLPGALYLGLISLVPLIALVIAQRRNQNFPFGGTCILIMVGVGLDTVKQIESQLQQRNYEGFLRDANRPRRAPRGGQGHPGRSSSPSTCRSRRSPPATSSARTSARARRSASRPRATWTPGEHVPDEVTIAMVRDRLAEADARRLPARRLPAHVAQAEELDEHARRATGRRWTSCSSWWSTTTRSSSGRRAAHLPQRLRAHLARRLRRSPRPRASATSAAASCTSATTTTRRPCGSAWRSTTGDRAAHRLLRGQGLVVTIGTGAVDEVTERALDALAAKAADVRLSRRRAAVAPPRVPLPTVGSGARDRRLAAVRRGRRSAEGSPWSRSRRPTDRADARGRAGRRRTLRRCATAAGPGSPPGARRVAEKVIPPRRHVVPGLRRLPGGSAPRSTTRSCTASPREACCRRATSSPSTAGAILDGWHGDAAITVPVGEGHAPELLELIRVTEESMWGGIAAVAQGGRLTTSPRRRGLRPAPAASGVRHTASSRTTAATASAPRCTMEPHC